MRGIHACMCDMYVYMVCVVWYVWWCVCVLCMLGIPMCAYLRDMYVCMSVMYAYVCGIFVMYACRHVCYVCIYLRGMHVCVCM